MEIKLSRGHFSESPVRSCGIAGFVLTEVRYPPNHKLPRHSHERACFMGVLQGEVTETYANKKLAGRPSTLIFRPSGEAHSDYFHNAGGRVFLIEIEPWWLDHVREHFVIVNDSVSLYCPLFVKLFLNSLHSSEQERSGPTHHTRPGLECGSSPREEPDQS